MKITYVIPAGAPDARPVSERVEAVVLGLVNKFEDWTIGAEQCNAGTINALARWTIFETKGLWDCPGFDPTFQIVRDLCENAIQGPTKSVAVLQRRAQDLIAAKRALEAYAIAFLAGQDHPSA